MKSAKKLSVDERFKKARELHSILLKKIKESNNIINSINEKERDRSSREEEVTNIEDQINYLKVGSAKFQAEIEALNIELEDLLK